MNRLKEASYDDRNESFTYDKVGNRLTKTTNNITEKYTYNVKNQLNDNIVAMNGNVNTSAYKKLENMWADAVKAKQKVIVDISPKYNGTSLRPDSFKIKYSIDGAKGKASIKNIKGGK